MSEELLQQILSNQELILKDIADLKRSNAKLDNHIDFIEKVYEDLSYPLSFLPKVVARAVKKWKMNFGLSQLA